MKNGLHELITDEIQICPHCCVGFPLTPSDKFCGFCGQETRALEATVSPVIPIYIDQPGPVELQLKIKNIGLTPCDINTELFDVQYKSI
jgi:hypothetical protein